MKLRIFALLFAGLICQQASALPILSAGDVLRFDYHLNAPTQFIAIGPSLNFSGNLMDTGESYSFQVFDSTNSLIGSNSFTQTAAFSTSGVGLGAFVSTTDTSGSIVLTWLIGSVNLSDQFPAIVFGSSLTSISRDETPTTTLTPVAVGEPGTLALLLVGAAGLALARRREFRAR
jgi:hypothetical protein